jgi:type 2 lantibiotic biosynthesis protein LanM
VASPFDSPAWRRADSLAERVPSLRSRRSRTFDRERAERELAHWRAQPPFDKAESGAKLFARRLEHDGIAERELLEVLGTPAESLAGATPRWLDRLATAYTRAPRPLAIETDDPNVAFLDAFEPLIARGLEELDAFGNARLFLPALLGALERLSVRSFALELGIARLQGELEGATPEERFASFVRRLHDRDRVLEILAGQPVLARRVVEAVDRWRDASAELLQRLDADRAILERELARAPLGRLTRVRGGAGDVHHGGRSVAILDFEFGARLVYKPRPLAVDARFQELVGRLNAAGQHPPLATLALVDRGTHGWVEFVGARPCATLDEIRAFYRRQGSWLALLHVLGATDVHYENVIAAGEHPIPIDLETLFHPQAQQRAIDDAGERLVRATLDASVLRVGLLPNRVGAEEDGGGADLGGLSAAGGQEMPDELLAFEGAGTDEMRATRKRARLPAASNRPTLDGAPITAGDHVDAIVEGFRATWELLRARRADLVGPKGWLEAFADVELRAVVRATRFYGLLLEEGLHPDFQVDALEYDRHLDRLWIGVHELPWLERALASEREDLLAGDVPAFRARAGSRDLVDTRGRRIDGYFALSGLEVARARVAALNDRERERQEWLIRGSIGTAVATEREPRWPRYAPAERTDALAESALRARALKLAGSVGERLASLALRDDDGRAAWMGFVFAGTRWELAPLPEDLYAGAPGVALFLEHLARATGEERFSALASFDLDLERASRLGPVGAFNGLGGLVYAFAHLAALREDDALLARAREIASLAGSRLDTDEDLDVIGGAAGLIGALESLSAIDPAPRWEKLMRACGERLASRARPLREGTGWITRIGGPEPATGFSHGASGIAWALLRLHRRDRDPRWLELAREGMRFERTLFDARAKNWLDPGSRRVGGASSDDGTTMTAWCYGAPGIGLARIEALDRDPEGAAKRDLSLAVEATCASGFGRNHCLCHGALGNLDFLSRGASDDRGEFLRIASSVLASLERDGFLCGMPAGVESPSLMNGLAGIGLGLLRLARPESVPSVLTLDPPTVSSL